MSSRQSSKNQVCKFDNYFHCRLFSQLTEMGSAGLFRGLSPSRKFLFLVDCSDTEYCVDFRAVLRSIPAAASTFAAFELTRGLSFSEMSKSRVRCGLEMRP
ncbi:hypothetical protein GALMADRAFT_912207 [Galerina marginata CBS 339.88]|uniref:Uncharacterized protein n=1 Tax=Galerina marginata (strain CBS 339.88) TaxID=685588 RepID=A0A067SQ75_GALM3|nr:hypothetical protein GALMADRAFT_912207 [Galerina marginata CBS 339.88]